MLIHPELYILRGAMRVTVSVPCLIGRWPNVAFGVLGAGNTCLFRDSASPSENRRRLFFEWFCVARQEALSDDETGITICISLHPTRLAEREWHPRGVAAHRLPLCIPHDQGMTTVAFSGRVARIDAAGDDPQVPRLIFGIIEDPSLHPELSFAVAPVAIFPLRGLEVAQVLEHQETCPLRLGKLDNTSAHQMRGLLIHMADLAPEVGIVLLVRGHDACLAAVDCDSSKRTLPKARSLSAPANEAGSEDGAFDGLDGADGKVLIDIQIHGADLRLWVSDLIGYVRWHGEGLFQRGMQPPLPAMLDQLGTAQLKPFGQIASQGAKLDPAPARSGPDFEGDSVLAPIFPLSSIEGSGLVPRTRRDRWTLPEWLLLVGRSGGSGFVPLFTQTPLFEL